MLVLFFSYINLSITQAQDMFVKVNEGHFEINGKPYYYIGSNYWYGGLLADIKNKDGKARLQKELNFLESEGINNLRVLVGVEGLPVEKYSIPFAAQPRQGEFNDSILSGLDYFLDQLGKRNMKAVLYFSNTWEWSGGFGQYLQWNGYGKQPLPWQEGSTWEKFQVYGSKFYSCKPCTDALDNYISVILNRTNTYTKVKYKDDPAVMAWELANEPRPLQKASIPAFEAWIHNTAAFIKSIDKNHMVTTGNEGEMGSENDISVVENINNDVNIDYMTIHIWPKNWSWFKDTLIAASFPDILKNTAAYIDRHATLAYKIHKPMVIEEFGLPRDGQSFSPFQSTHLRDTYYKYMFDQCIYGFKTKTSLAGCNFWGFGGIGRPIPGQKYWKKGDDFVGEPPYEEQGLNTVFDTDTSTWNVIKQSIFRANDLK